MNNSINLSRALPVNISKDDFTFFEKEFHRKIEQPSILKIKNPTITAQGIVFEGYRLRPDSLIGIDSFNSNLFFNLKFYLKQTLFKTKIYLNNSEILVITFDQWYNGYFHWITDTLPRILFLSKSHTKFILLIPESSLRFIQDSLQPFKIDSIRIINRNECIIAKQALLVTHTAPSGNYNESLINELRIMYRNYFKPTSVKKYDKIYVSRNKSQRRRIANEKEVSTLLNSYGFETIYFEDYSFEEQVNLASEALFMIGAHGAGLTNMLFMNGHTSVLEFRHRGDSINLCYFSLASALNLHYYYQFGDNFDNPMNVHADMTIDVKRLKENVELMFSKK